MNSCVIVLFLTHLLRQQISNPAVSDDLKYEAVLVVCLKTSSGTVSITVRRLKSFSASSHAERRPSDQMTRNDDVTTAVSVPKSASNLSGFGDGSAGPDDGEQ